MKQEIRSSQSIHTYGPGAIADFPELSVLIFVSDIPQDSKFENGQFLGENAESPSNRIEDDRLANAFNVESILYQPNK